MTTSVMQYPSTFQSQKVELHYNPNLLSCRSAPSDMTDPGPKTDPQPHHRFLDQLAAAGQITRSSLPTRLMSTLLRG
jgi:hypothetical protein